MASGHVELALALVFTFAAVLAVVVGAIGFVLFQWRHEAQVIAQVEREYRREAAQMEHEYQRQIEALRLQYKVEIDALRKRVTELEGQLAGVLKTLDRVGVTINAGDDVRIGGDLTGRDEHQVK